MSMRNSGLLLLPRTPSSPPPPLLIQLFRRISSNGLRVPIGDFALYCCPIGHLPILLVRRSYLPACLHVHSRCLHALVSRCCLPLVAHHYPQMPTFIHLHRLGGSLSVAMDVKLSSSCLSLLLKKSQVCPMILHHRVCYGLPHTNERLLTHVSKDFKVIMITLPSTQKTGLSTKIVSPALLIARYVLSRLLPTSRADNIQKSNKKRRRATTMMVAPSSNVLQLSSKHNALINTPPVSDFKVRFYKDAVRQQC